MEALDQTTDTANIPLNYLKPKVLKRNEKVLATAVVWIFLNVIVSG